MEWISVLLFVYVIYLKWREAITYRPPWLEDDGLGDLTIRERDTLISIIKAKDKYIDYLEAAVRIGHPMPTQIRVEPPKNLDPENLISTPGQE